MTSCARITSCGSTKRPLVWDRAGIPIVRPYTFTCTPPADLRWSSAGATAVSTMPHISQSSIQWAAPSISGAATSRARNSSWANARPREESFAPIPGTDREHKTVMPVPKPIKLAIIFATIVAEFVISSDATAQRKITATFVAPNLSQTIPWIAKEAGIFAKHGIDADVILLTGSPRAVQTLLAGDIEYTIAGGQSAIRARMHGADPVMLATSANFSSQRALLRPESNSQRLQDLKGKTVGVTQYGSGGDTFLRAALRSIGLRPDADVSILQMGGTPQVASSLIAGKGDAGG